jgi:hypothetical protein
MYPGNTIGLPLIIKDGYGQLRDADSTPAVVVVRNGLDTTVQATVSRTAPGLYTAAIALPGAWLDGDVVDARITAVVQGYTDVRIVRVGIVATAVSSRPTLAQMEASTALTATGPTAAQTAVAVRDVMERTGGMLDGKASQTSVTALGSPAQADKLANLAAASQAGHDATQAAVANVAADVGDLQGLV